MYFSSRIAAVGILAVAFFLVMWGFGSAELQAQHHNSKGGQCEAASPAPQCPCNVRMKPLPQPCDVPAPQITKPCVPPSEGCCPVDPKEVKKSQKEAEHAQHEAAEACKRQQEAAKRAQRRIDEAAERGQKDIDRAHAHLEHENGEWAEAVAKYNSLGGGSESVAEETPQKETESATTLTKPEPQPETQAIIIAPAPTPSVETPSAAPSTETAQNTEAPQPQPKELPKQLPRTASPLELIGLIGLASMSGSLIRFFRR